MPRPGLCFRQPSSRPTPCPRLRRSFPPPRLTNAGLSTISLAANTTITIEKGAQITLNPGGTFNAWARKIEDYGGITALGGSINLALQTNMTSNQQIASGQNPNYISIPDEVIYIGPSASLVARGERIDNSGTGGLSNGIASSGYTNGGSVSILDQTVTGQGVAVMAGALIDVSGGWVISPSGKVTGGNAGSLTMQGDSLALNGTLQAQSLVGIQGGPITLTAANITVAAATPPASYFGLPATPGRPPSRANSSSAQASSTQPALPISPSRASTTSWCKAALPSGRPLPSSPCPYRAAACADVPAAHNFAPGAPPSGHAGRANDRGLYRRKLDHPGRPGQAGPASPPVSTTSSVR